MMYGVVSPVIKCASKRMPMIRPVVLGDLMVHLLRILFIDYADDAERVRPIKSEDDE